MKKKQLIQIIVVILLSLASSFVAYSFLPENIAQRGSGTMPKLAYVLTTFVVSIVFSIIYYVADTKKYLYCAAIVGIIIPIFAIFFGNVF